MNTVASSKQAPKLLRSSAIVSLMTMLSRVLGLARDIVFAWVIGASGGADAFFVAFKIPNFLRRLFAEGAFAQAFVPVLSQYRALGPHQAVRHFIDRIAGCLGASVISLSVMAVVAAPLLTLVFAPGFYWQSPEKYALTVDLIRITFPYLALISLAGFAGAILNSYDRFAIPAVTPVILNVVLIGFALFVSPMLDTPVMALGWGVLAAGVLQLLFQLPFLARIHLLPQPKMDWRDESVRKVLRLMAPAMFAVSVSQINLMLDTIIASLIADGSVSWLYYSDRLIELPLGVFGIAIATVILPTLSRQHSGGKLEANEDGAQPFHQTLDWALRCVLFIAVPATAALIVLAEPIILTLFQHSERFTQEDARMASYSLQAYALGLVAFMLIKVLITGYFSRQDTKTPTKIGIIAMASNMVFNLILVVPFHTLWQIGHVGLALATAASAILNAGMLLRGLKKGGHFRPLSGWFRVIGSLVFSAAVMAVALLGLLHLLPDVAELSWPMRVAQVSGLCCAGFVVYLLCMLGSGWRLRHLKPKFSAS